MTISEGQIACLMSPLMKDPNKLSHAEDGQDAENAKVRKASNVRTRSQRNP